ncbi:hypothetical protein [Streptomyces sp. NPDC058773]|uniref:hypothetical protein n=1 Tax=Streptomyces sp. NPDC058773 TaxID=3346632 RepID=UPI0036A1D9FD
MITTEPVGEWFWDVTVDVSERRGAANALELFTAVHAQMVHQEIAAGWGRTTLSLAPRDAVGQPLLTWQGSSLAGQAAAVDRVGLVAGRLLSVQSDVPGVWFESGAGHRAEKLFSLGLDVWGEGGGLVTLSTFSDAWLTLDLRERAQPAVHAENAPRLEAVLRGMSKVLGSAPDPGDPTRYAHPTATGFEDLSEEGADYDDSWGTFEVPARWKKLMRLLPDRYPEQGYESWTDGPVRYVKVLSRDRVMGYLWAGTAEDAAGYEPRTAAGEAAFEEGIPWLLHFAKARQAGVPPLAALREVAGSHGVSEQHDIDSLDMLQEYSGRH